MNDPTPLREQLWDYCYGLLSATEAAQLEDRIRSEPHTARLYAEVRLELQLVATAARVDDRALHLAPETIARAQRTSPAPVAAAGSKRRTPVAPTSSRANWLLALAASGLIAIIAYGLIQPQQSAELAGQFLATRISAPGALIDGALTEGVTQRLEVTTTDAAQQPRSGMVDVLVRDSAGEVRLRKSVVTATDGKGEVELPGAALTVGSRLEVVDKSSACLASGPTPTSPSLVAALPVRPAPPETVLLFAAPGKEVGETVRVAEVQLNSVTKELTAPVQSRSLARQDEARRKQIASDKQFRDAANGAAEQAAAKGAAEPERLESQADAAQPAPTGAQLKSKRHLSSASGSVASPAAAAAPGAPIPSAPVPAPAPPAGAAIGGARPAAPGDSAPAAAAPAMLPREKAAAKLQDRVAESQALADSKPEDLNRAQARPADAKPTAMEANAFSAASGDKPAELAKPAGPARGGSDRSSAAELKQARAAGVAQNAQARDEGEERFAAAQDKAEIPHIAGARAALPVAAEFAERPLLARVRKEGQVVFQRRLDAAALESAATDSAALEPAVLEPKVTVEAVGPAASSQASRTISVELPPEIDGLVSVELFDASRSPPRLVARRELIRDSGRGLSFAVEQVAGELKPGGKVKFRVVVQDEAGTPADVAVGVRVWSEQALAGAANGRRALASTVADGAADQALRARLSGAPETSDKLSGDGLALGGGAAAGGGQAKMDALATHEKQLKRTIVEERKPETTFFEARTHTPTPSPTEPASADLALDNQAQVAQQYAAAQAAVKEAQQQRQQLLGGALAVLGCLLLAAPLALFASSAAVGRPVWWTTLGVGGAALIFGSVWLTSGWIAPSLSPTIPTVASPALPKPASPPAVSPRFAGGLNAASERAKAGEEWQRELSEASSEVLFWRPPAPLTEPGVFEFEVDLPAAPGDYRILLDGFGQGRTGQHQLPLTIPAANE